MKTLNNVLKFIELKGMSTRSFEKETRLSNGTINNCLQREADLSEENIAKIVEKYSTELVEAGFHIIDLTSFGGGKSIINKGELAKAEIKVGKFGHGIEHGIVMEPLATYGHTKDDYSSLIQIKTAAGKTLNITPENRTEIELLNAFLAEKEERQKEAEQRAERAEKEKDRLYSVIEQNLTALLKITGEVYTNSKLIVDDLSALTTEVQAEHRAMMDSLDLASKQKIGTTRANAGIVELASHELQQKKGKNVASSK
jgi:lambda repressor-like predicted transcriptional regulator